MHGNEEDPRDVRHREGRVSFNFCNRNTLKIFVDDDDGLRMMIRTVDKNTGAISNVLEDIGRTW
jgi:hypothetical protein